MSKPLNVEGFVEAVARGEIEQATPTGSRMAFSGQVRDLVAAAGEDVRRQFAAPEVVNEYVQAIHEGLKERSRTALNLYAQIMKLIGAERRVMIEVWHRLGVRDESEAGKLVERAKRTETMTAREAAERCLQVVVDFSNVDEPFKARAVRMLGAELSVERDDA